VAGVVVPVVMVVLAVIVAVVAARAQYAVPVLFLS
jgi:hypothetical protein